MKAPDFQSYISQLNAAVSAISQDDISRLATLLLEARDKGNAIYVFGNGDSASNATHYAADLSKGTIVEGKKRFNIISLNANIPLMTAWSNDVSYDSVFKEQLVDVLRPGDVVIGISGSGNSPNVLNAIGYANSKGAATVGISAFGGGKLAGLAKTSIVARTDNMEIAEDIHWIIGHLLKVHIIRKIAGDR